MRPQLYFDYSHAAMRKSCSSTQEVIASSFMGIAAPILRELTEGDLEAVKAFADLHIGENYFSLPKLRALLNASVCNGIGCSFVLVDSEGIQGIRLAFQPGQWLERHPSQKLHSHLWKVPLERVGYFQSLFLSAKWQGQGWGGRLSMASVENIKSAGGKAVVCHSWDESPHNSSRRYLEKLGFEAVISIPEYWKNIDYKCVLDGSPCLCTATEMVKYI